MKALSSTLQSGRYTLSYPRGRSVYTESFALVTCFLFVLTLLFERSKTADVFSNKCTNNCAIIALPCLQSSKKCRPYMIQLVILFYFPPTYLELIVLHSSCFSAAARCCHVGTHTLLCKGRNCFFFKYAVTAF